jgi:probable HAF family extracellular repeat protein
MEVKAMLKKSLCRYMTLFRSIVSVIPLIIVSAVVLTASSGCGGGGSGIPASPVGQPSLKWLGVGEALAVSADGSVVVGYSYQRGAFRWTAATGMQIIEGCWVAWDVSSDGSVVVGLTNSGEAFRWTITTGVQVLGAGQARGISANGSVIVGSSNDRAFRWVAGAGMQDIGPRDFNMSEAYSVSADGSVVVGDAGGAFRWTVATGFQYIGSGTAWDVSADGSVVVGSSLEGAFRWTAATGVQYLGTLLGSSGSSAFAVSGDGSIVVGRASITAERDHAIRWTPSRGIEDLNIAYADLLTPGSYLAEALDISPDGRYIVGRGYNAVTGRSEAFLLDTGIRR